MKLITSTDVIKLAAMECAASCVVTGLNISGLDYRYFMLNYWHLIYYGNVLMLRGSIFKNDLGFAYGIEKKLVEGNESKLVESLGRGKMAIFLCRASKLRFFPGSMLGLESNLFQHHILLHGYVPDTGNILAIDPIADFLGEVTIEELLENSIRSGELIYYTLEFPRSFQKPTAREIFQRETESNFKQNVRSRSHPGNDAFSLFLHGLVECLQANTDTRNSWIDQNNITISSIIKSRPLIWQSFCSLDMMTSEELRTGGEYINEIVKLWTALNFLLIKLRRKPADTELLESVQYKVQAIKAAEYEFLEFMHEKGRGLYAV